MTRLLHVAALAGAGDYLVTITVGGEKVKQVLHVERLPGGGSGAGPFGEDDEQPSRR